MPKPVGTHPILIDDIVLRRSTELPEGHQALYNEQTGHILWVGLIGTNPNPKMLPERVTAITLHPDDYERVWISQVNSAMRERIRQFRMN